MQQIAKTRRKLQDKSRRKLRQHRTRNWPKLKRIELFVAEAISAQNLKRQLRTHLSFKMHWKILYGAELMQYLVTQKSPLG